MIFGLFTLAVAIIISAVSAFYSITGLTAIFTGAFWSIVIMGGALELGKITATVWLHKYWHRAGWQFKTYLVPAIVVLMFITSMGTFGYLSAAHLSQSTVADDISAQVSLFDEKIKTQKDNIDAAKRALQQMDAQVDQMLSRTTDDRGTNRAVQIRKQQASERKSLQKDIEIAQKEISTLQSQREPLAAKSRVAESHIGPIKYIAALIYGDNPDANLLERAVRWVIILLVLVFDPLALVLILAAEQTIEWARADRKLKKAEGWHQEWVPDTETWPKYELDDGPLTDEQIDEINRQANVQITTPNPLFEEPEAKEFFDRGKELAKAIDQNHGKFPSDNSLDIPVLENEEMWSQRVVDEGKFDPQPIRGFQAPADDDEPINPLPKPVIVTENQMVIPDMSISANDRPANAGFGIEFPKDPMKGDMFLRVDFLPTRQYKWNGQKWIEIGKDFAYDEAYIKHLVEKLDSGEYDVDLLTVDEQDQISRYLNEQSRT